MTKPIYDPRTFESRESVGAHVAKLRKAFLAAIDAELAPLDVSAAQWMIIMILAARNAATAGELAKEMNYDPGAMTRLLDRLENKGLESRSPSASDRRAVALELTRAGQALRPKISAALAKVNNHLLRGFTREEVDQLQNFLIRMIANA